MGEGCGPTFLGMPVVRSSFEATRALRARVLRPGRVPGEVFPAGHDDPGTRYWAVLGADGEVLSTANAQPVAPAWDRGGAGWWQLRGMATAPEARGRGHAGALVRAVLAHAEGRVWLNGRRLAVPMYAREGFVPVGEEWLHPEHGPHTTMVSAAASAPSASGPSSPPGPSPRA